MYSVGIYRLFGNSIIPSAWFLRAARYAARVVQRPRRVCSCLNPTVRAAITALVVGRRFYAKTQTR